MVDVMPGSAGKPPPDPKQFFAEESLRIDASCRLPVIVWFLTAVFWLLLGSLLAMLTSIRIHNPDWLWPGIRTLAFGHIRPAHLSCVALGWSFSAAIGVSIWQMCRLSRAQMIYPKMLVVAAVIWNIAMIVVSAGSLPATAKASSGSKCRALLLLSLQTVPRDRCGLDRGGISTTPEKHVYVTQWYLLAAMIWMPWLYTTAVLLIFGIDVAIFGFHLYMPPATGVLQATTNWWFAHNVLGLWLTPVAVGTAYYIIPKVLGRPVYSYYLSVIGFWALALFYSWAGMHSFDWRAYSSVDGFRIGGRQHDDADSGTGGGSEPSHDLAGPLSSSAL